MDTPVDTRFAPTEAPRQPRHHASHLQPPSSEGVPPLDPRARAAVAGREVVEGQRTGEGSSAVSGVV